jgi:predicted AAA+ superfamily ATPase
VAEGFGGGEYLWRDVPLLVALHDIDRFERFAIRAAQASGELLRQQEMARELDVSHRTVARWLEVLEACFLTVRAEPWERDLGRRQIQRPKLYWLGGNANLETEVVTELYRNGRHMGLTPRFWHWRDSNGFDLPLLVEHESEAGAVPCMVAEKPGPVEETRLRRWMRLAGMGNGVVIGRQAPLARQATGLLRYGLADF